MVAREMLSMTNAMADKFTEGQGGAIEITSEMIEAGVSVLADDWGVIGAHAASELAEVVFRAMVVTGSGSVLNSQNVETPRCG